MSLFEDRIKDYFGNEKERFLSSLKEPSSRSFFLNTLNADAEDIFSLIDFPFQESGICERSYYYEHDNIGKTKAYELGVIYPQDVAASLTSTYFEGMEIPLIVDMCASPGGKTIDVLNRIKGDCLCIANDVSMKRCLNLSSNLERLGLDQTIITNKDTATLSSQLQGMADLVILDAPCSGEGMIRKYPEILDTYSLSNIESLAVIQKELLDQAYEMVKKDGYLLYSTCTYAFEEDEDQIVSFLKRYPDMEIVPINMDSHSKLAGTVKLSPVYGTEGQFFALMKRKSKGEECKTRYLKTVKEKTVEDFLSNDLELNEYYLYRSDDHFYLSKKPLIDLGRNVLRYSVYIGDLVKKRFEPSHTLYRSNSFRKDFRYVYDLDDREYDLFISGNSFPMKGEDHHYLITYKGFSLGYGKCSQGVLKNKYPKGLRRML